MGGGVIPGSDTSETKGEMETPGSQGALQCAMQLCFATQKCIHINIECDNVTAVSFLQPLVSSLLFAMH